jgi:tRNA/rRNA methyltransferase
LAEERISRRDGLGELRPAPVVVLVEPQMGENIGASARAMLNFGLSALRLVNPRDGWPNPAATAMASGAAPVIDGAKVFASVPDAIADCQYVVAATARTREMLLPVLTPSEAGAELKARIGRGETCALMFGGERAGLLNEDLMRADALVSIPVNPSFASLNLAQSVVILAYEWALADGRESYQSDLVDAFPAPKEDFERLMEHLIGALDDVNYFFPSGKRPVMVKNLRIALSRAGLTEAEVRSLRGVIKALTRERDGES